MQTRTDSTADAANPKQITYAYSSPFFNLLATSDDSAEQISQSVISQLNKLDRALSKDNNTSEKKSAIATDLIQLTASLPLSLALNILIEASQQDLFINSPAHQIILNAITKERVHTSPLITGKRTLSYILQYQVTHAHEVEKFLYDPELLLMWINLAPVLEISRLFQHFYQRDSIYYVHMRNLAIAETEADKPGKALLCSTLMSLGRPTERGEESIRQALLRLKKEERIDQYGRVLRSLHARINPNVYNICGAADCYVNANKLDMCAAKFAVDQLQGASFRNAKLDHAVFSDVNLTEAVFNYASLAYANFNHANLQGAKLCNANLAFASLENADLRDADLTGANLAQTNLSGANLHGIILEDAIFNDAKFLSPAHFHQQVLEDELMRLQHMIQNHPQEAKLRIAICHDIIRYTQSTDIQHETAIHILQSAHDHAIFGKSYMEYINTGINLAASTFISLRQAWFSADHQPATNPTQLETNEQKLLRQALETRMTNAANTNSARPPMPDHPPPAPH